jgi:aminotransferase EvaB
MPTGMRAIKRSVMLLPPLSDIPLNDLKRVYDASRDKILDRVTATMASGWWLNGSETAAFCRDFAAYIGADHCLGVANGTEALEIAMRALLNVQEWDGQEVVTVANAGGYSTIACRLVGLTPVYADIEEASQLASLSSLLAAIGPQTAFVVATHLYGNVLDVLRLREMMDAAGYGRVPILEDCAQAHGGRFGGRRVGALGDIATFSFYPTKNLGAFGDGGAIVTSCPALADACFALRQYGWAAKYTVAVEGGRNSRLDEVQAAILRVLLPGLEVANENRRAVLRHYAAVMPKGVSLVSNPRDGVAHLAIVLCEERDRFRQHLADRKIQSEIHYPVLDCDQPGWRGLPQGLAPGGLPVSRSSVGRILTLPCFPTMTEEEIGRVCDALAGWEG